MDDPRLRARARHLDGAARRGGRRHHAHAGGCSATGTLRPFYLDRIRHHARRRGTLDQTHAPRSGEHPVASVPEHPVAKPPSTLRGESLSTLQRSLNSTLQRSLNSTLQRSLKAPCSESQSTLQRSLKAPCSEVSKHLA